MASRIFKYQTIADLNVSENQNVLSKFERGLVFERKAEIVNRLIDWRVGNERLGLVADLTDFWVPEQREHFFGRLAERRTSSGKIRK